MGRNGWRGHDCDCMMQKLKKILIWSYILCETSNWIYFWLQQVCARLTSYQKWSLQHHGQWPSEEWFIYLFTVIVKLNVTKHPHERNVSKGSQVYRKSYDELGLPCQNQGTISRRILRRIPQKDCNEKWSRCDLIATRKKYVKGFPGILKVVGPTWPTVSKTRYGLSQDPA